MTTILEQEHGPELGPAPTLAHLVGAVLVQGYLQRLGIVTVNVVSSCALLYSNCMIECELEN